MIVNIDVDAFYRRMKKVYIAWKNENSELRNFDALICAVGTGEVYTKSIAMQTWLFGYELSDTLMVIAEKAIYILASKSKIDFLRQVTSRGVTSYTSKLVVQPKFKRSAWHVTDVLNFCQMGICHLDSPVPPIKLMIRDKGDNDKKNFEKIAEAIKDSKNGKLLGVFVEDKEYLGTFMDDLRNVLGKFAWEDMSNAVALIMAPKEDSEVNLIKKACQTSMDVFSKYLKEQIMDIIDSDKRVQHSEISEGMESAITDLKYVPRNIWNNLYQLDVCYPAIIQSGGNYKLNFSHVSDKETIHFGAIVVMFGVKYQFYCSNIARTFLVNPSKKIQSIYNLLVSVEEQIFTQLKDGAKLCDVYKSAVSMVRKENSDLVDKLTYNFGFSMGIEFQEASLSIAPNCNAVAKKGMVFNVNLGLTGLINKEATDDKGKEMALFIGDTVMVNKGSPATLLTPSNKEIKNIARFFSKIPKKKKRKLFRYGISESESESE